MRAAVRCSYADRIAVLRRAAFRFRHRSTSTA